MAGKRPILDPETGKYKIDFYTPSGRRVRRSLRTDDFEIAREAAKAAYREECRRDLTVPKTQTYFAEAAVAYVKNGGEDRFLNKILKHLGPDATVEQIDDMKMTQIAAELYPDAHSETWRRQVYVPLNAVINFAKGKRRRPRADQPRTRWLTPEEAERLLSACCEASTAAKVAFLLGTGCRTGEMFALDRAQIWPETGEALVHGKNGDDRMIRIAPRALSLLSPVLPDLGAVFLTPKGLPYKLRERGGGQMAAAFNKARDAAGLGPDVTPHVLRHTWATWFYAQTRDFGELMDLGGWRKADMANRYRKIAPSDLGARVLAHGWDYRQDLDKLQDNRWLDNPVTHRIVK